MIRRIVGDSMSPALASGQIIIASSLFINPRPGQVLIFYHDGKEKIKRVESVMDNRIFFIGDNPDCSTDSRYFGWVDNEHVLAKVIWPKVHT
jgi:phage repressor protein C with HTH and peptisase S24 domain